MIGFQSQLHPFRQNNYILMLNNKKIMIIIVIFMATLAIGFFCIYILKVNHKKNIKNQFLSNFEKYDIYFKTPSGILSEKVADNSKIKKLFVNEKLEGKPFSILTISEAIGIRIIFTYNGFEKKFMISNRGDSSYISYFDNKKLMLNSEKRGILIECINDSYKFLENDPEKHQIIQNITKRFE